MTAVTNITKEEIVNLLIENGFYKEDIEKNFDAYLRAILKITIENYLLQLPPPDQKEIVGEMDTQNPEDQKKIIDHFEEHFKTHQQSFKVKLSPTDFATKIKNFVRS